MILNVEKSFHHIFHQIISLSLVVFSRRKFKMGIIKFGSCWTKIFILSLLAPISLCYPVTWLDSEDIPLYVLIFSYHSEKTQLSFTTGFILNISISAHILNNVYDMGGIWILNFVLNAHIFFLSSNAMDKRTFSSFIHE